LAVTVRRVTLDDRRLLWEWANDQTVRAFSFHSQPISWESHVAWFDARVGADNCLMLIVEQAGRAVGQVRFDVDDREAELTISIAAEARGMGLGTEALGAACREFRAVSAVPIVAYVRPENTASVRTFEKAGFTRIGLECRHGFEAVRFESVAAT
jgi:UDP-2,4-diacetamido-2,4,6-trideoxy-beta-L-altropyranose hydrolase